MFNAKRIEDIRNKIQISTLLSDHEKSDWLNLLELMNDKQLGELEEILGATNTVSAAAAALQQPLSPQPTVAQKPAAGVDPKLPPLSHIANMPVKPAQSPAKVAIDKLSPKPQMPRTAPVMPPSAPIAPVQRPSPASEPVKSADPEPIPLTRTYEKLQLKNITEIQKFSPSTLREFDLQSVVDSMRESIAQYGYYKILQLLETSPLYASYIKTGKAMLGHDQSKDNDPNSTLTQAEFEFITDLLRHMRFNAW